MFDDQKARLEENAYQSFLPFCITLVNVDFGLVGIGIDRDRA